MAHLYDIVLEQVAKEKAKAKEQEVALASMEAAAREELRAATLAAWEAMPVLRRTVTAWFAKLDAVRHYDPSIPMQRTDTAQEAHIACLSVANPGALAKYINEVNVFWHNIYRHDEERRLAEWTPPTASEAAPIDRTVWDSLSQIQIEPKE